MKNLPSGNSQRMLQRLTYKPDMIVSVSVSKNYTVHLLQRVSLNKVKITVSHSTLPMLIAQWEIESKASISGTVAEDGGPPLGKSPQSCDNQPVILGRASRIDQQHKLLPSDLDYK